MADGDDAARTLELAAALILSGHTDQRIELPVDRAAYNQLLSALSASEQQS